jgi:hypothetical protein
MDRDLATSVEMPSAAIDAIPTDGLDQSTPRGCSPLSTPPSRPYDRGVISDA